MNLSGKKVTKIWQGFTLIEALIALLVISVVTLSFSWLFRLEHKINQQESTFETIDWHLFLLQLEHPMLQWEYLGINRNDDRVMLRDHSDEGKLIELLFLMDKKLHRGVLIKRKSDGYEPILTHVIAVDFLDVDGHLRLEVVMEDGNLYQADIHPWQN